MEISTLRPQSSFLEQLLTIMVAGHLNQPSTITPDTTPQRGIKRSHTPDNYGDNFAVEGGADEGMYDDLSGHNLPPKRQ